MRSSKGLKVFIMKNHIVAIAEEEVLNPESPADAKIIESAFEYTEELKQKKEEKSQYIDPDAMKKLAEDLNKRFPPQMLQKK